MREHLTGQFTPGTSILHRLDARAKFISVPLDRMVEDKEISSYETTVDESCYDTFLEDETMSVIIRYLSRGDIREVVIDIGRSALSSN